MFIGISVPNSNSKHEELQNDFLKVYSKYESTYENKVPIITVEDIDSCIRKMKMGKAAGVDGLTTEHLLYCHPLITVQLSLIFTSMVKFGYVPPDFGVGIIIPLIKNVDGNATCKDNYRGITLSPVLSKVLEMVLILKFDEN